MLVTSHWTDHRTDEEWPNERATSESGLRGCGRGKSRVRLRSDLTDYARISDVPTTSRLIFFAVPCNSRSAALIFNHTACLNPSNATGGESCPKSNLISLGLPRYCGAGRAISSSETRGTKTTREDFSKIREKRKRKNIQGL